MLEYEDSATPTVNPAARPDLTVELTASPLQRIGAFALAVLASASSPGEITPDGLVRAVDRMTTDLLGTTGLAKAAEPGGFWLSASYMLWPNSKINPTARAKQSPEERRRQIRAWRSPEAAFQRLGVPCAYCGREACDWYGKVDIPLGASVAHRNTTAPEHQGTPLCYPCVACLWAFPYGARLAGGRAAVIHSWDDAFLGRITHLAVQATRQAAGASSAARGTKPGPYERELTVLRAVRGYGYRLTAPVELIVLSNSNKEQLLVTQEMGQPIAEWLRSTVRKANRAAGYAALTATQATKQVPGEAFLAKRVFTRPAQVLGAAVAHLLAQSAAAQGVIPPEVPALSPLLRSYCNEVLSMDEKDVERITQLAARLALLLGRDSRPGPFRDFIRANSRGGNLYGWFRSKAVDWQLFPRPEGADRVLLPVRDYRLLFEDERSWSWRRLLTFAVLEALAEAGWEPKGSTEELRELRDDLAESAVNDTEEG
ncbi:MULTISPECIES: hypothetical protein [unclassified Streptomyces]|uniref:hypothetical protein n=1 Tax=unclassified Streptomyces TaxID=2593676 RepID=UPI002E2DBE3C|nr:hypothetical protein [Streptomyces sp. NBC_00223]